MFTIKNILYSRLELNRKTRFIWRWPYLFDFSLIKVKFHQVSTIFGNRHLFKQIFNLVKFSFSEKATKIYTIFLIVWTFTIKCPNHEEVAFSEKPNFTYIYQGFHQFWDYSGVWPKVSLVFEDFKLKIQKSMTKTEVFLSRPCWLSQLNWDSQQGRDRNTSILLVTFWKFNT